MGRITEATAPCSVEVLGGAAGSGSFRFVVALDRRVWCRVDRGVAGLVVRSKDSLRKLEAPSLHDLAVAARRDPVVAVLEAARVTTGAGVETHVRVPEGSGLAVDTALSVALAAACLPADQASPDRVAGLVLEAGAEGAGRSLAVDVQASLHGGAHLQRGGERVKALALDPARLEECLLLVDAGLPAGTEPGPVDDATARRVLAALEEGRYGQVGGLLAGAGSTPAGASDAQADRVRGLVQAAGGAAWRCRGGRIMAVWAAPGARGAGPREDAIARLQGAGLRPFPARVDVRGLEVD